MIKKQTNKALQVVVVTGETMNTPMLCTLKNAGYQVFEAVIAKSSLKMITKLRPNLVIVNDGLLDMDSLALCQKIRDEPSLDNTAVLIIIDPQKSQEMSFPHIESLIDTIEKPITPHKLLVRADVLLTLSRRTQELKEANERLKQREELQSQLVFNVSHELRAGLQNIKLYLGLLRYGPNDKRLDYEAALETGADQLGELVQDMLDLSRLKNTTTTLQQWHATNINRLIQETLTVYNATIVKLDIQVIFTPHPDLPVISGHTTQLRQVFTNLLVNAIRYTSSGYIHIQTFCDNQKKYICLQVEDSGIGIAPEDIPHIFKQFYRGQTAQSAQISGTGLGLSIVQEIVNRHHGRIDVKSDMNKGTTFSVWLPISLGNDGILNNE